MLLVDDHEAERLEPHRFLYQGVRAHHQVHLAGGDRLARAAALGGGKTPGQQGDPEPRARQQPLHGGEVLLGEDFGGRHERDLLPVLHREHRREQSNDGLAGTDIALQQAVHRMGALHVVGNLLQRHALTRRQPKRQHGPERVANAIVHARHQRLALRFRFALAQQQAHLEAEELLEDETALRRRPIGVEGVERRADRGEVHLLEGRPAVRKPEARPDIGRQRIVEVRGEPQQRVRDQPPLHLRRDRSRALVHGNDPARVQRIGFRVGRVGLDQLEVGVGELQAGVGIPLQRAVEHDVIARVELILQERGVEPRDADRAARVADSASKIRKPGRRVGRSPHCTISPLIVTVSPSCTEATGRRLLRSS